MRLLYVWVTSNIKQKAQDIVLMTKSIDINHELARKFGGNGLSHPAQDIFFGLGNGDLVTHSQLLTGKLVYTFIKKYQIYKILQIVNYNILLLPGTVQ
jgi:hypothetical protein